MHCETCVNNSMSAVAKLQADNASYQ